MLEFRHAAKRPALRSARGDRYDDLPSDLTWRTLTPEVLLLTSQLLLLVATIPLLAASVSVSRTRKLWHRGFKLAAVVIAVAAVALALFANSTWSADGGWLAAFLPMVVNLGACIWILHRSRSSARLRRRD